MGEGYRPLRKLSEMGISLSVEELYPKDNRDEDDVVKSELRAREDGYLGDNIEHVRMVLLYEKKLPIRFINVTGNKNVQLKSNYKDEKDEDSSRVEVRHLINLKMGDPYDDERNEQFVRKAPARDFVRTSFAMNNVRMVVLGEDGEVRMYGIGVKSQFGALILRIHLMGIGWAYWVRRSNRQQVGFTMDMGSDWNEWPQFQEEVQRYAEDGLIKLTHYVVKADEEAEDLTEGLRKGQARVKWYDAISDTGCLVLAPGETFDDEPIEEAKVEWRQVVTESEFEIVDLEDGDLVSFQSLGPIHQDEETRHPTSFKAQALAVQVLDED